MPSPRPGARPVRRAAVLTHGKPETIGPALAALERAAHEADVELLVPEDEVAKHGLETAVRDVSGAELAVVLGGDGTMLRALNRFLGTDVAVVGVNFGRVGFLTSIEADDLESGLRRVFAGEYVVHELPTLRAEAGPDRRLALNDVVGTSSTLGRMIHVGRSLGGEDLGVQPCDGIICATPSGSTAYNLSSGGPVLVWGLRAMVLTFVAPHSLDIRPLVVPRTRELEVWNRTKSGSVNVIVDGRETGKLEPGEQIGVRLGEQRSLLATLPECTFFARYRQTFAS